MFIKFKDYQFAFLGVVIILIYYFLIISIRFNIYNPLYLSENDAFYLSLGIFTDLLYINILQKDNLTFIEDKLNFFTLFYLFDRSYVKLFGIESLWFLIIIYKLIAYLILFYGFKNILKFSKNNLLIFSVCLSLFCCLDIEPFSDRWPRPQLTNIFVFYVILASINYINQIKYSRFSYAFYGMSQAIIGFSIPWASAAIFSLSSFAYFYKSDKILKIYVLSGFLIIFIPHIIIYIINSGNSSHSEYLGVKQIYNKYYFLLDFYTAVFINKKFLFLFLLQLIISFISKRKNELIILSISFLTCPLLFVIIGNTLQSYHLVDIFKEFQIILFLWSFFYFVYYLQNTKFSFFIKPIFFISILLSIFFIAKMENSWIERTKEVETKWSKNKEDFSYLDTKSSNCKLVTNHKDLLFYWLNFKKGTILPPDGFTNYLSINLTLEKVKMALNLLSEIELIKKNDVEQMLKIATHNYYASSRSTITKSLEFDNNKMKQNYINSRQEIDSMKSWALAAPDFVYKEIMEYNKINVPNEIRNNSIVIYKNFETGQLIVKDFCTN